MATPISPAQTIPYGLLAALVAEAKEMGARRACRLTEGNRRISDQTGRKDKTTRKPSKRKHDGGEEGPAGALVTACYWHANGTASGTPVAAGPCCALGY
jgi:hypothetical protein